MVTKAQFDQDPYQRREVVTAELDWLGDELCRRTGRPRVAAGTKGDWKHLRGAHRSQDFILRSPLCTSRTYTRQDGLTGEQERHIAGFDFTPGEWGTSANRALMRAQTARLRAAMLDGRLLGVREVIGTLDGRTVSGTRYNGQSLSSDDSHLDHWHLTLDRRRCRDQALMERIVAVALGQEEETMTPAEFLEAFTAALDDAGVKARLRAIPLTYPVTPSESLLSKLTTLFGQVDALVTAVGQIGEVDTSALEARLGEIQAAVELVDDQVVSALVDPSTPDEQVADALRQLLADRPGVLALLAQS